MNASPCTLSSLRAFLKVADMAEERARRAGIPEARWPASWFLVANMRGTYASKIPPRAGTRPPEISEARAASDLQTLRHLVEAMQARIYGSCGKCGRTWPSVFVLSCPLCGGSPG